MYGPSWPPVKVRETLTFAPGALVAFRYFTSVLQRLLDAENGVEPSSSDLSTVKPFGSSPSPSSAPVSSAVVRVTGAAGVVLGVVLGVGAGVGGGGALTLPSPPQAVIDSARAAASARYLVTG